MTSSVRMTGPEIPIVRKLGPLNLVPGFKVDRLDLFRQIYEEAGDVGAFMTGSRSVTLLSSVELAYQALVEEANSFEKGPVFRSVSRPLLGNGLLTSSNEFHRGQRRMMAPAFGPRSVAGYAEVMVSYANHAAETWKQGATLNLFREMTQLTLGIAGKTLFDADVLGEALELGREITVATRHATTLMNSPLPIPTNWPTPGNRRAIRAIERLNNTVFRLIEERRASGEDKGDFLSMLLHAQDEENGRSMSDLQVRDEAMTIFLAGHETTANALTWAFYLLSQNPAAYSRLREEVERVLSGRLPSLDDLPRLPYCLQVFKEALRLYPPAYVIARQAVKDVRLGEHFFPAGSILLISPYVLHRRPDYFPQPEQFMPERFAGEAEKRWPRCAYLPFGAGPRNCIGSHFALLEGHLVLAALSQKVRFELIPGAPVVPEPLITLRPRTEISMKVRRWQSEH